MNLLIPMAGRGSRFSAVGYTDPKPLIPFLGKKMIEHVVDTFPMAAHKIFVVLKEHIEEYQVDKFLLEKYPGSDIVVVDQVTEGAACTVLLAKHLIDNDEPLAIMNSDNIIEFDPISVEFMMNTFADGVILTFEDSDPKWSFAKTDEAGYVQEVVEKVPASTHATAGLYFWRKGSSFIKAAEQMIEKELRHNNEFYVAPVYTQNVLMGEKILITPVIAMYGVGTPEDLEKYIAQCEEQQTNL